MADELDQGSAGEVDTARPAPAGMTRDEYHERERAAFLADSDAADTTEPAAKPAKAPAVEPDDDDDDAATEAGAVAEDDDDDQDEDEPDVDDDDQDEPADADDDDDAAADPELAKRLAKVRRTEQRQRESLERERAVFARERAEWQQQSKQLTEAQQRFDKLAARAKYDSYSVLRELGVSDDDMVVHAQHLYARSKDAAVKPEHRAAADRAMREREITDELKATRSELAEVKESLTAREQAAAAEREADVYVRRVVRKVDDSAPLTKALTTKNPAKAREALTTTALQLAKKLGQLPKASQVVAAHERKLSRELRDLGIEPPVGAAPATKAKPGAATIAKPGVKPSSKAPAPAAKNGVPTRDEMIAEMEELDRASRSDN